MRKTILVVLFIGFVAAITNGILIPVGLPLIRWDWANFLLVVEEFRKGEITPYCYQQTYGGLTLTPLRVLFAVVVDLIGGRHHFSSTIQIAFSYLVLPVLMAISSYFLLRSYYSRRAAFVSGILVAVGFHHWAINYGNDFYIVSYLLGAVLLGWRGSLKSPIEELNRKKLFLSALLCGNMLYNTPITIIYVLAFYAPDDFFDRAFGFLKNAVRIERFFLKLSLIPLGIFLLVECFGREFLSVGTRVIKIDALPNLKIGFLFIASAIFLFVVRHKKSFYLMDKLTVLTGGLLLGYLPTILSRTLLYNPGFESLKLQIHDARGFFTNLIAVPSHSGFLLLGESAVLRGISAIVLCLAMGILLLNCRKKVPIFFTFILTIISYCLMDTFHKPPSPYRYLFPLFPVIVLSFGSLYEYAFEIKKSKWMQGIVILSFCIFSAHQMVSRFAVLNGNEMQKRIQEIKAVVDLSREHHFKIILTEDIGQSSGYMLAADRNPLFWSAYRRWGPFEAENLANQVAKEKNPDGVGVLLEIPPGTETPKTRSLMGRDWVLTQVSRYQNLLLFEAK